METVICKNCGLIDEYTTELKNGQKVATCSGCNKFIKNIAYNPPKFYFGKYKSTLISECTDLNYLNWFIQNTSAKSYIKNAVQVQINKLTNTSN